MNYGNTPAPAARTPSSRNALVEANLHLPKIILAGARRARWAAVARDPENVYGELCLTLVEASRTFDGDPADFRNYANRALSYRLFELEVEAQRRRDAEAAIEADEGVPDDVDTSSLANLILDSLSPADRRLVEAVRETGSIRAAARRLRCRQDVVSRAVRLVEEAARRLAPLASAILFGALGPAGLL